MDIIYFEAVQEFANNFTALMEYLINVPGSETAAQEASRVLVNGEDYVVN